MESYLDASGLGKKEPMKAERTEKIIEILIGNDEKKVW